MVFNFSGMIYKYYYRIGVSSIIINKEGEYIHNKIFNNIPHFTKERLRVGFLQYGFVMYKNKLIIHKR